ncbi:hypothetical protein FQN50_009576 [Emmonsiellopsis sp. PD_5]|nr:hypothetical protein FQN50_009576 [Emmonsiellopsis sp. PD_5]
MGQSHPQEFSNDPNLTLIHSAYKSSLGNSTSELNKTWDFYGYAHLFYPAELQELCPELEHFLKRPMMDKFHMVKTEGEKLELFNPLYIQWLATNGHMDPETVAVIIPKLLSMTLIWRSQQTVINGKWIGEEIPPKHVNAVTLRMNPQEQAEYCALCY